MTVLLLARSAVVTAVTGAVLAAGLTVAGAAGATSTEVVPSDVKTAPGIANAVLKSPQFTGPHGRKLA
jgi:hypothetical protein